MLFVVGFRCAIAVLTTLVPHHFDVHIARLVAAAAAAVAEAAARLSRGAATHAT